MRIVWCPNRSLIIIIALILQMSSIFFDLLKMFIIFFAIFCRFAQKFDRASLHYVKNAAIFHT